MNIANQLKKLRQAHGYTQAELAEKLNVSRKTVSSWENGRNLPGIPILIDLSNLYQVSIDKMVKENGTAYKEKAEQKQATLQKLWLTPILAIAIACFILSSFFWMKDSGGQGRSLITLLNALLF